ncbi:TfoX/Sxy family protein [Paenirhodobacter sp.]|jgi:TfoX/Sxy family transcriptional regulator of competence genes|uniref:TfoX/Sxy family protein n=1 Tax=Paenirhodobacter sp. TaxID=1965326 RepID=UPI003B506A99
MPTSPETADFLLEQLGGQVRLHRMFGEYAVKVGAKTVGLLCDDALFVRQLPEVTAFLGDPVAGLPYPGAKPWWRIDPDAWEDSDRLRALIGLLAELLPEPTPRGRRPRH